MNLNKETFDGGYRLLELFIERYVNCIIKTINVSAVHTIIMGL